MFARVADEYDKRFGLDESHLRAIAQLNFDNARSNPNAQTRGWTVPDLRAGRDGDDEVNPVIEGRLRRFDCSQMTDGGAGVVLVTDDYLRDHPDARPIGRIDGWGHRTVGLGLQQKLDRSAADPYVLPHVRGAVLDAFGRAEVSLDDVDGFEVHDCFTPSEYLAIDHIGLTGPGESWKAIENGEIEIGGALPINPSGGLIGGGHPVGASGVRMLARRGQTGQRRRGRVSGRGRKDVRHVELRRKHGHHRQLRRRIGKGVQMDVEVVGKFLSTLPEDDDHPYRTGPWRPQTTEWDADNLTVVDGEIPRRPRRGVSAQHREPAASFAEVLPSVRRRRHDPRRRVQGRKGVLPQPIHPHRRAARPRTRRAARCGPVSPNPCRSPSATTAGARAR